MTILGGKTIQNVSFGGVTPHAPYRNVLDMNPLLLFLIDKVVANMDEQNSKLIPYLGIPVKPGPLLLRSFRCPFPTALFVI